MREEAKQIVDARFSKLLESLYEKIKLDVNLKVLSDPDVQFALYRTANAFVRTGDEKKQELLVNLISDRIYSSNDSNYQLILNQVIEILPKLTGKHLDILSFLVTISSLIMPIVKTYSLPSNEKEFIDSQIMPFLQQEINPEDIRYLSNCGIGSFGFGKKLDEQLVKKYPNLFTIAENDNFIIKKLNEKIYADINGSKVGIREYIESLSGDYKRIFEVYDDKNLYSFSSNPIGELLGFMNCNIKINSQIDARMWY